MNRDEWPFIFKKQINISYIIQIFIINILMIFYDCVFLIIPLIVKAKIFFRTNKHLEDLFSFFVET